MKRSFSILQGFRLASGITLFYLSLLVLIPLCALVWKTTELSLGELFATLTNSRVLASFRVSILTALAAAFINLFLGFVIAWVLVRYPMPMKRLFDAVIDLPFSISSVIAGLIFVLVFGAHGWFGSWFAEQGFPIIFAVSGIILATLFVTVPFVARALAVEPKFLLLDEPFRALDANVRKELRRWLRRLHEELHVTSIIVTHDQEEAMEVASRIVVMDKGRIEQVGTPEEVYDNPASPFVSSFIGNVNVFHGRLQGETLDTGAWQLPIRPPGNEGAGDDTPFAAYIRPHDFELLKTTDEKLPECRVRFIQPMGSGYRLEVVPEHAASDGLPNVIDVELPRRDFRALDLAVGERVYLRPTETHWFEAGNAI